MINFIDNIIAYNTSYMYIQKSKRRSTKSLIKIWARTMSFSQEN